ncbi:MAG: aldose epimerase family protein [Bacteroidota bacterium]
MQANESPSASLDQRSFGQLSDGREVHLFILRNSQGMEAHISNYGATLVNLYTPDRNGQLADVVLGFDELAGYLGAHPNFGSTVGRYANRIAKGRFRLDGQSYQLAINNGENHLHGGIIGIDKKLWSAHTESTNEEQRLQLRYLSKNGEENYPGNLQIEVNYILTEDNALEIVYQATTDLATVVNFTHHSYFNLAGESNGTILDHELMLVSDATTEVDAGLIPTGQLADVTNTPFDFRTATAIGARINADHTQLKYGNGYDHNWVIRDWNQSPRLAATLYDPASGRFLEVITTEPGIQVYTGNWLEETLKGKGGRGFRPHQGVCLETQHFPNSPNHAHFPSTVLRPGETYRQKTVYRFTTREAKGS